MASRLSITHPALRGAFGRNLVRARRFNISTSSFLGLKESSGQNPEVDYDKHKQDSLDKQRRGKGHWKPELASDSEEAVKADRNAFEDAKSMQERTKRSAEETSKAGTSMRDGL